MNKPIDPRIQRLELPQNGKEDPVKEDDYWSTYEVFNQKKRGAHHEHVGSLHAPSGELALVFAKEQFGRRLPCVNMWVVKSSNVYAFNPMDDDMFESATSPEKNYRDPSGFKVREKISQFRKKQKKV